MSTLVVLTLVFAFVSSPQAAAGGGLDDVDLSPLLGVNRSLTTRVPLIDPFKNVVEDHDVFVSRGGALTSTQIVKGFTGIETTLLRGVAASEPLDSLVQALAASQVGFQDDCHIPSPSLEDGGPLGTVALTWYGRGTRRNTFRVTFAVEDTSPLPDCPVAVEQLLTAVANLEIAVFEDPESEILNGQYLRPLLRVHTEVTVTSDFGSLSSVEQLGRDLFVSVSGATQAVSTSRIEPPISPEDLDFRTILLRGIGSGERLAALRTALAAAQVGFQSSCDTFSEGIRGRYEIVWYGRGRRRNDFTINYRAAGEAAERECPAAVIALVGEVNEYYRSVLRDSDSEVLTSR